MFDLDNLEAYRRLDPEGMIQNIDDWPDQVETVWREMQKFPLPTHYIHVQNVVLLGIGGSAMGNDLVRVLASPFSPVPVTVVRDYDLPIWVGNRTLAIATSYSGNTEETLSAFEQAAKRGAKLMAITSGGQLASLASRYRAPIYKITYGAQPRAALGYSLTAVLAIFVKLDLVELKAEAVKEAIVLARSEQAKVKAEVPYDRNPAKQLAKRLYGRIPIIYGAGTLQEVARRFKGQFNENAKTTSFFEILPELNHNSLVGLEFPEHLKSLIFVLLLQSKYDHPRNKLRQRITSQILDRRKIDHELIMVSPTGGPVAELLQTIVFGDYVSYYLSLLNEVDPNPVTIINFLKEQLRVVAEEPKQ